MIKDLPQPPEQLSPESDEAIRQAACILNDYNDGKLSRSNVQLTATIAVCAVLKKADIPVDSFMAYLNIPDDDPYKGYYPNIAERSYADLEGDSLDMLMNKDTLGLSKALNFHTVLSEAIWRAKAGADITAEIGWLEAQLPKKADIVDESRLHSYASQYIQLAELIHLNGGDPTDYFRTAREMINIDGNPKGRKSRAFALVHTYAALGRIDEALALIEGSDDFNNTSFLKEILYAYSRAEDWTKVQSLADDMIQKDFGTDYPPVHMMRYDQIKWFLHMYIPRVTSKARMGEDVSEDIVKIREYIETGRYDLDFKSGHLMDIARIQRIASDEAYRQTVQDAHDAAREYLTDEDEVHMYGDDDPIHFGVPGLAEVIEFYIENEDYQAATDGIRDMQDLPYSNAKEEAAILYAQIAVARASK